MPIPSHYTSFASENVDEPSKDERIGHERRRAELRKVADERKRQEDDHLQQDEVLNSKKLRTARDSQNKGLEVLRDEDDVRAHEAYLGHRDRRQDGKAHPWTV